MPPANSANSAALVASSLALTSVQKGAGGQIHITYSDSVTSEYTSLENLNEAITEAASNEAFKRIMLAARWIAVDPDASKPQLATKRITVDFTAVDPIKFGN